jgi:hypothetical protein
MGVFFLPLRMRRADHAFAVGKSPSPVARENRLARSLDYRTIGLANRWML